MINAVQSGAAGQLHKKKVRDTKTETTNYVAKKLTIRYTSSFKKYFPYQKYERTEHRR